MADDPDLKAAQTMRDELNLSLEACVRRYVEKHPEPLAAVWSHKGRVRFPIRGSAFPWIKPAIGSRLATDTLAARAVARRASGFTRMQECHPGHWTDAEGVAEVFEQTRVGKDGHAITLLWATLTTPGKMTGWTNWTSPNSDSADSLKPHPASLFRHQNTLIGRANFPVIVEQGIHP